MVLLISFISFLQPTVQVLNSSGLYDFCSRSVAMKACPTPPTIDNVDLRTFLGSYYEVGSSARFKFKSELGLVCAKANFSVNAMPPPGQNAPVTIKVLNSGLQVVGSQTLSALSKMASSASDVCSNERRMCAILSLGSKVSDALSKISSVIEQIAMALPTGASLLRQASATLNSSLWAVRVRLDNVARSVNAMARTAAQLDQAAGPVGYLIQDLRNTVVRGGDETRGIGGMVLGNLSGSLITEAAGHLTGDYEEQFMEAAALIEQVTAQITRIEGQLSSVGGPLADMIMADRSAMNATAMLVVSAGEAIQNQDQRGSMALKMQQTTQPFKLIALEGLPVVGYRAALIYSCEDDSNGDPSESSFMLSRTPSLATQTVESLLEVARNHGIYTDCDGAFVPTVQRGGGCGDEA